MQAPEGDIRPLAPVMVGEAVGTVGGRDVGLDHNQVRLIGKCQRLDVLILNLNLIVCAQVAGQRC